MLCAPVECNGGQAEEHEVGLQSTADQEVPHPDVLPEQSTGDFDFNEFFNLEKTMPGLASVSTGVHCGLSYRCEHHFWILMTFCFVFFSSPLFCILNGIS